MRSAGFFWEFQADGICKVEQWSVWNSYNFTSSLTPSYWINSGCQSCQLEPATPKQLSSQSATQQLRFKPHTSALPTGTFTSLDFNFEQNSVGQHDVQGIFRSLKTKVHTWSRFLLGWPFGGCDGTSLDSGAAEVPLFFRGPWRCAFTPERVVARDTWWGKPSRLILLCQNPSYPLPRHVIHVF